MWPSSLTVIPIPPWLQRRTSDRVGLQDRLDLERDVDLVTDDDAAVLHRDVELDAEVLAGDRPGGREAGTGVTERRVGEAVHLEVERNLTGDAVQGEEPVDDELGVRAGLGPYGR